MYYISTDCFVPRNDGRTSRFVIARNETIHYSFYILYALVLLFTTLSSLPKANYNKYNTIIVANDSKGMKNLL